MDIETWLLSAPWVPVGIWVVLYVADYYLTIWGARLHAKGAKDHLVFEAGYELTPQFQKDINHLRTFSPRFLGHLALSVVIVLVVWRLARRRPEWRLAFLVLYGGLVFRQLAILVRHARNIALFRRLKDHQGIEGCVRYSQWLTLEMSWVELAFMALLVLMAALVAGKATLFGGALALFVTGLQHRKLSRKRMSEMKERKGGQQGISACSEPGDRIPR